jgi:hypothetical protein
LVRKSTTLIGNTSFRSELYRTKEGFDTRVTFKNVAPNPYRGESNGQQERVERDPGAKV